MAHPPSAADAVNADLKETPPIRPASSPEPQPLRRAAPDEAPLDLDQVERDLGKAQRQAIEAAQARVAELGERRMARQPKKEPQCSS